MTPDADNGGWGPHRRRAAISLTFDNLGEAAEIEGGTWPVDVAVGRHRSVTRVLPRIFDLLDAECVRASFFTEGWNADVYPSALATIVSRGHDLGYHSWRHELWGALSPAEQAANLDRGLVAVSRRGLKFIGFRPPGGVVAESVWQLLRERGIDFCSPAGDDIALHNGVAVLPFDWKTVDAYYYLEQLAGLRGALGDRERVMQPSECHAAMEQRLADATSKGGYTILTFHPFLLDDADRFAVLNDLISRVVAENDLWCAPCSEVATWVRQQGARFVGTPHLSAATWR